MTYNMNFIVMREEHSHSHYVENLSVTFVIMSKSWPALVFSATFCLNSNGSFASQAIYSWHSIKVLLNHTLLFSRFLAEKTEFQNLRAVCLNRDFCQPEA
jgi:hypothetical protein